MYRVPGFTKDPKVIEYGFGARISSENKYQDYFYITCTRLKSGFELAVIGRDGYFASRRATMIVYGNIEEMVMYLFDILAGTVVIEGYARAAYPSFILNYANYRAMCERDENRAAAVAEKVQAAIAKQKARIEAACIAKLEAAQQAKLDEAKKCNEKLSEALADRDIELAKKDEALQATRQQLTLLAAEFDELRSESDVPTMPLAKNNSDTWSAPEDNECNKAND